MRLISVLAVMLFGLTFLDAKMVLADGLHAGYNFCKLRRDAEDAFQAVISRGVSEAKRLFDKKVEAGHCERRSEQVENLSEKVRNIPSERRGVVRNKKLPVFLFQYQQGWVVVILVPIPDPPRDA